MGLLSHVALLVAVWLFLVAFTAGQAAVGYSVLYATHPVCDVTVDGSGFIYTGLCEGGVDKFNSSGSAVSAYEEQFMAALASSTSYTPPLYSYQTAVSASGTVWTLDLLNAQLVGVSNMSSSTPTVSSFSIATQRSSWAFTIARNSNNLWLVFPNVPAYPVQLLSPQGAVLQQLGPSNTPALADYVVGGIYAAVDGSVYVGGCYPAHVLSFIWEGPYGYDIGYDKVATIGCDIRHLNANGTLLNTFVPVRPPTQQYNFSFFRDIVVDSSGTVYAIDISNSGIFYKWNSNATQVALTPNTPLYSLAISPSHTLYALIQSDTFAVVTVNSTSLTVQSSFEISSDTFTYDIDVALSHDGQMLYATSYFGSRVLAINATSGAFIGYLGVGLLVSGRWVTTDRAGNVYVTDTSLNVVLKLSSNGTYLANFSNSAQPFGSLQGVAVNPSSDEVIAADGDNSCLVVFSPAGAVVRVISTAALSGPGAYYPPYPESVVVSSAGVIAFADGNNGGVIVLFPDGNSTNLVTRQLDAFGSIGLALAVALSEDGRVFVSTTYPNAVYSFTLTGELLATLVDEAENLNLNGLAYSPQLNLIYAADRGHNQIVSFSALPPPAAAVGSLCTVLFGLPGDVDYPWSIATSLHFQYLPTLVTTSNGASYQLVSGNGTRTYTNRFGVSTTSAITLGPSSSTGFPGASNLLYVGHSTPFDIQGIALELQGSPVQLPGNGPLALYSTLTLFNSSGSIAESSSSRVDPLGTAFLSSVPGVLNLTVGPSNINGLAVSYASCQAPISFTNGLRPPTQPSASNGAIHSLFSYHISDGALYSVSANLTLTATSAFATTQDALGSPYQTLIQITGTRLYTHLPTGGQLRSNITGRALDASADQRLYTYALLAAAPGVYTQNTAPFLDNNGLSFSLSPSAPFNGLPITSSSRVNSTRLYIATTPSTAVLTEAGAVSVPSINFQQQTLQLLSS